MKLGSSEFDEETSDDIPTFNIDNNDSFIKISSDQLSSFEDNVFVLHNLEGFIQVYADIEVKNTSEGLDRICLFQHSANFEKNRPMGFPSKTKWSTYMSILVRTTV